MKLKFTKMHGAGNDFIVVDAIHQDVKLSTEEWRRLADRRFGIGADQILVVERPTSEGIDFRYRIFNSDGGEVEQCGNGARAFARFVSDKGLSGERSIRVETMKGIIAPRLEQDGSVTVDMGAPQLDPAEVPFDSAGLDGRAEGEDTTWPLAVGGETVFVSVVSMGNPHAVQVVDNVDTAPVESMGPAIETHARFPKKVNAGFMQVLDRHHVKLRVFERGAGETLACGTGACAAVVAGIRRGLLDSPVRVSARGGELSIAWAGVGQPVYLSGPAVTVFEGEVEV
ncbi:diaminopimelate epimerase [Massilia varians]|uniref:diaminopimelate epimerase n=1 Tax=Massilia varians TaxID=457921 RepID=UPI0025571F18|nr:diaminopimelate epimerase [Massilia varians]MDK6076934.1 diaminopimelate epimerase [Massilia varians]